MMSFEFASTLFHFCLDPKTSTDEVKDHILANCYVACEAFKHVSVKIKYSAFKVSVPYFCYNKVKDVTRLPPGTVINRFTLP
jgi:hypothetical protein